MNARTGMDELLRGVVDVISRDELEARLSSGERLRVKLGIDPTSPDIHLGHTVVLNKLRQFQDMGHQVVLIIGDFTALIGDPSGRNKTRPPLTREEVERNAATYLEQVGKVLEMEGVEVVRNSEWFESLRFEKFLHLASLVTVARMLERDDFSKRYEAGNPIGLHEFVYPLMQGYDSVMVRADVEIGATDQTFNLLVGRDLQRHFGQRPQVCMTLPMLVGTDGTMKMSKSYGNYIGVTEPPGEMFGKIMSIPDSLMGDYLRLLTDVPEDEIASLLSGKHPRDVKEVLAKKVVARFWGEREAEKAALEFRRVFSMRRLPEDMPEVVLSPDDLSDGAIWIVALVRKAGFATTNSEARRLVQQGAVSLDGRTIQDVDADVTPSDGSVLKVGKRRFGRIRLAADAQ